MRRNSVLLTILIFTAMGISAQSNLGHFYSSSDGTEGVDLKLGKNGSATFSISTQDGGSAYWTSHARRYGAGFTWSRESSGSVDRKIAYLYGASGGHYYQLFDHNQTTKVQFHSNGDSYFNGGNVGIGTDTPDEKFEISGDRSFLFDNASGSAHLRRNTSGGWTLGYKFYGTSGTELGGFGGYGSSDVLNYYYIGSSYQSPLLAALPSGSVGIGTSAPQDQLHIFKRSLTNGEVHDVLRIQANTDGNRVTGFGARLNFSLNKYGNVASGTSSTLGAISVYDANNESSYGTMAFATKERYDKPLENKMWLDRLGNLGIGTESTFGYKLAVNGTIGATEVKVENTSAWPDYVFEKGYNLLPLKEVETFIAENKHLPEIPSEAEVMKNGINLGEMDAKLLQKIEELTLYLIEQNKKIEELQKKVVALESE